MARQSHEAEIESWATVFGLSNKTVELAKQLLPIILCKKVYSMSKPLLALYTASIMSGEYIPLVFFIAITSVRNPTTERVIRVRPRFIRFDIKKYFGIELSTEKMVEAEVRGLCRVLKLDPVICETAVCTAVSALGEQQYIIRKSYTTYALVIIRLVMRHMNIRLKPPPIIPYARNLKTLMTTKRAEKYLGMCLDRARTTVARQLQ